MKTDHLTIMFTDLKGFTLKTSKSTRAELKKLLEMHEDLIIPVFDKFEGTIIKTIGDAFMVTFRAPTDAVLCGMEIQRVLNKHNQNASEDDQLQVRVAINSGEVTVKGNDVFGEAVNIAARLEGVAEAGDIYFTESVYLAMNKSEIPTTEVGYRHFKGIPEQVKVYKVLAEGSRKGFRKARPVIRQHQPKKWKKWLKWAGLVLLILFIIGSCSENNEKNQQRDNVDEGNQELKAQIEGIAIEVMESIENGNEVQARRGIKKLRQFNEELGKPDELNKGIQELERLYRQTFE